jgi:hypothetical protein
MVIDKDAAPTSNRFVVRIHKMMISSHKILASFNDLTKSGEAKPSTK